MKRIVSVFSLALILLVAQRGVADDNRVMGNAPFIISQADLPGLKREALDGSADAAQRLYNYFSMVALNYEQATRWAQISAENGHPVGQYNFAVELIEKGDEESLLRGKYWLRRAAEQGDLRARQRLDKLDSRK